MTASLAERLRAIAADPTPEAIAELPRVAVQVDRIERALDEIAADALESATLPQRPVRRRPHLVVVE